MPPGLLYGDWLDEVSIEVPPGPRGFQPSISIIHTKNARNSALGSGYSLVATQRIERRSTTGGLPGHTELSEYRLNGEKLILDNLSGSRLANIRTYRKRTDDGSEIRFNTSTNVWSVLHNGWTWTFGELEDAGENSVTKSPTLENRLVVSSPQNPSPITLQRLPGACRQARPLGGPPQAVDCATVSWLLAKVTDPYGNVIRYTYRSEPVPVDLQSVHGDGSTREGLLDEITYETALGEDLGRVTFSYQDRPDPQLSMSSGAPVVHAHRLTRIRSFRGSTLYSRYDFGYKDEAETDCDGLPFTDPEALLGARPLQTLLQRISRVNATDTKQSRSIRCIETFHQPLAETGWQPAKTTGDLRPIGRAHASVLPINLNGDGMSDLVVIHEDGDHQVLASIGDGFRPFRSETSGIGVGTWSTLLDTTLTSSFMNADRGWLILDIDRDGYSDLLHEIPNNDDYVQLRRYQPKFDYFIGELPELRACDLRYAQAADIDGDGHTDLIRRPHAATEECPARLQTKWLRNLGQAPWFERGASNGNWRTLEMPLVDPAAAGLDVVAPELNPDWTPALFVADQARFSDVNGDGITDVMYALHTQWEKHLGGLICPDPEPAIDEEPCQWRPVANTRFSRIYFGDGFGSFIDSGLGAGFPILSHRDGTPHADIEERWFTGYLGVLDMDRSGTPELLSGNVVGTQLLVHHWRGLLYGFSDEPLTSAGAQDPYNLERQFEMDVTAYPQTVSSCNEDAALPVLADFNGDGALDLLEFRYDPDTVDAPACYGQDECVTIRFGVARPAEGRVVASTGSWGGHTTLEWGYSGDRLSLWHNPELPMNVEALEAIDGPNGRIELTYSHGAFGEGRFQGFGIVTRRNARGGVESYASALTPLAHRKPLYGGRYRIDGSLEKLTVHAYGDLDEDGRYTLDASEPFVNPRIRECHFEVERGADVTLSELIADCLSWNQRIAPSDPELWGIYGLDRQPALPPARVLSEIAWGEEGASSSMVTLTGDGESDVLSHWQPIISAGSRPVTWRWPAPRPRPEIPNAEEVVNLSVPAIQGTGRDTYITDWTVERQSLRASEVLRHRDTSTTNDDVVERLTWQRYGGGRSYRLTRRVVENGAGEIDRQLDLADFSGFQDPGEITDCGADAAQTDCVTTSITYDERGLMTSRENDIPASRETWDRPAWCASETYTNPAGESRLRAFDAHCVLESESSNGVERKMVSDGYHRPVRLIQISNDRAETVTTGYSYDDVIDQAEDTQYQEPRVAILRNGVLDTLFFDDFGRETRHERCSSGTVSTSGGNLDAECLSDDSRILSWTLYGTDGLPYASADPLIKKNETAVFTITPYRDGSGRPSFTFLPGNSPAGLPSWTRELAWRAPGRDVTEDASGRIKVMRYTTLSAQRRVNGRPIWEIERDAFDRVVRRNAPDGPEATYRYDSRSQLAWERYSATAPVLRANGTMNPNGTFVRSFVYDREARIVRDRQPNGLEHETQSDELGRLVARRSIAPNGTIVGEETWSYSRDGAGYLLTTHVDELGVSSQRKTDGLGRLVFDRDAAGVERSFAYDAAARTITVEVENGSRQYTEVFEFDAFGSLETYSGPSGTTRHVRDGAGRLLEMTDVAGSVLTMNYHFSGMPREDRLVGDGGDWLLISRTYDELYRLVQTQSDGIATQIRYDDLDRPERIRTGTQALHFGTHVVYDGESRRLSEHTRFATGFPDATTRFDYDPWHRQVVRSNPEPGASRAAYDRMHRQRLLTDEERVETHIDYDLLGRRTAFDSPHGGKVKVDYQDLELYRYLHGPSREIAGVRLAVTRDAYGAVSRLWVDTLGRIIARQDADGVLEERVYDGSLKTDEHRIDTESDLPAMRTHYHYDSAGELVGIYGPADPADFSEPFSTQAFQGYAIELRRGPGGRLESIDAAGEVTELGYDPISGLLEEERFLGLTRRFDRESPASASDSSPRVVGETLLGRGGEQRLTNFSFDAAGRLVKRLVVAENKRERSTWSLFTPHGQPTVTLRESGPRGAAFSPEIGYEWVYDLSGRPIERRLSVAGAPQGSATWSWYQNGALKTEQAPFGKPVAYDYGTPFSGRLQRVLTTDDGAVQFRAGHGAAGQLEAVRYPEGVAEFSWSPTRRIMGRRFTDPAGAVSEETRTYDGLGRLGAVRYQEAGRRWEKSFGYDGTGHLISERLEDSTGGAELIEYLLDPSGARLETRLDGRPVSNVTYDPAYPGALAVSVRGRALAHDPWNGVTEDQRGVGFVRSASGAITEISTQDSTATLLRDADGIPVVTETAEGARQLVSWRLDPAAFPQAVQHPDGTAVTYAIGGGGFRLISVPPNGAPIATAPLLDPTRSLRTPGLPLAKGGDAFGASVTRARGGSPFSFAGMETVPGTPGLHLARYRAYDGETGRFLSPDPIGLAGGQHRMVYAASDPVQYSDPLGLWACPAQPGSIPDISVPDLDDRFPQVEHNMIGDINTQWEITQLELSMGLDVVDFFGPVDLGPIVSDPNGPITCAYKCEPPEGEPGLPDDDVSPVPMGPIVMQAAGGGGGGSGGGIFSRLFGGGKKKGKKTSGLKGGPDFLDPEGLFDEPWAGCDETLSNAGCRHPVIGPGETSEPESKRVQNGISIGGGGGGVDDPSGGGLTQPPLDPRDFIGGPLTEGERALIMDNPILRSQIADLQRHRVVQLPQPARATVPDPQPAAPEATTPPSPAATPHRSSSPRTMTPDDWWRKNVGENPTLQRRLDEGIAHRISDLADYPWELNVIYGETHWSRGDAYRDPLVSFEGVNYVASFSFHGFGWGGSRDLLTDEVKNNLHTGGTIKAGKTSGSVKCKDDGSCTITYSLPIADATCSTAGSCGVTGKVPLGPVGTITIDPAKEKVKFFLGPNLSAGPAKLKLGIELLFGVSSDRARDIANDIWQQVSGNEPKPPPDPVLYKD